MVQYGPPNWVNGLFQPAISIYREQRALSKLIFTCWGMLKLGVVIWEAPVKRRLCGVTGLKEDVALGVSLEILLGVVSRLFDSGILIGLATTSGSAVIGLEHCVGDVALGSRPACQLSWRMFFRCVQLKFEADTTQLDHQWLLLVLAC